MGGTLSISNAVLNLGGSLTLATLATVQRSGGTVKLVGTMDNTGTTLLLDEVTGTWNLAGGTIVGGAIVGTNGAGLVVTADSVLDGVTLNADLTVPGGAGCGYTRQLTVTNGLVLNSTLTLARYGVGSSAVQLTFAGSQTLGGSGQVVFVNSGVCTGYQESVYVWASGTLTIGPGITIHGQRAWWGTVRCRWSTRGRFAVMPGRPSRCMAAGGQIYGVLSAQDSGGLSVNNMQNVGEVQALAGGVVDLNGSLALDGQSTLLSQLSGTVRVSGHLLGNVANPQRLSADGNTTFDGSGTLLTPQFLEVMSQDLGLNAAGFSRNFAYGTLALANNTCVRLVDMADNAPGAGAEVLYVNSLLVPVGTTLDMNGVHVYARARQISGTVLGGSVAQISDSGTIAKGSPTSGSIATSGELDEWTFFGRAGQTATVLLDTGTGTIPTPHLDYAELRLWDPLGRLIGFSESAIAGQVLTVADVPLTTDGIYRIQVRAPISHPASAGNYQLTVWDVTPLTAPLVLNQQVNGRIETPYSVERWTFSAVAGQQVRFDLVNTSGPGIGFDLRGPNGWIGFTNLVGDSSLITLPQSGEVHTFGAYDGRPV